MTITLASSVNVSPVLPTRQVTLFATVLPPTVVVPIFVANASGISVIRLPCFDQASAVRAIGT